MDKGSQDMTRSSCDDAQMLRTAQHLFLFHFFLASQAAAHLEEPETALLENRRLLKNANSGPQDRLTCWILGGLSMLSTESLDSAWTTAMLRCYAEMLINANRGGISNGSPSIPET
jgi:hypothetical protein